MACSVASSASARGTQFKNERIRTAFAMAQPKTMSDIATLEEPATEPAAAPTAPKVRRAKRRWGISLYQAWCKKCSICGEFCPTEALINDELGTPVVADEDKCTGCMQCVHRCPDFCVEVFEKPLPTDDESDLTTEEDDDGEPNG
jgi:2-oxoglutarate ferredoxin oxidoreductase subunit delta